MNLRTDELGTATETEDGRLRLDFERLIDAPLEAVWRALTDPDEACGWWTVEAVEVEPGVHYGLVGGTMPPGGPIVEWDPPRLLAFEWNRDETNTPQVITFRLEPEGDRTRLHFSHEHLLPNWAEQVLPGWHSVLLALEAQLLHEPYDGDVTFTAVAPHYGATKTLEEYRARSTELRPQE